MSQFLDLTKPHDHIDVTTPEDIKKILQEIGFSSSKALQVVVEQLDKLNNSIKESFNLSVNPANEALSELIGSIGKLTTQAFDVSNIIGTFSDYSSLIITDTFAEAHNTLLPVINKYVPYEKLDDTIKENLKPVKPKSKITFKKVKEIIELAIQIGILIGTFTSDTSNDNRQYDVNSNNQQIIEQTQNINIVNHYFDIVIDEVSANSGNVYININIDTFNETETQKDDITED